MCTTIKSKDKPITAAKAIKCWKVLAKCDGDLVGVFSRFHYVKGAFYADHTWEHQLKTAKAMHASYKEYREKNKSDLVPTDNLSRPLPKSETTMTRGGFHSFKTERAARSYFARDCFMPVKEYALALCEIPEGSQYLEATYPSGYSKKDVANEWPSYLSQGIRVLKVVTWGKNAKKFTI